MSSVYQRPRDDTTDEDTVVVFSFGLVRLCASFRSCRAVSFYVYPLGFSREEVGLL